MIARLNEQVGKTTTLKNCKLHKKKKKTTTKNKKTKKQKKVVRSKYLPEPCNCTEEKLTLQQ